MRVLPTALRTVLALLATVAVTVGNQPLTSASATLTIYSDSLASGWSDWSWNTQINWQDTSSPHSGSDDVAFTFNQGWDGLSAHSDAGAVDTSPYDLLQFWINGGSSGGQDLSVYLEDGGSQLSPPVDIAPYLSGSIAAGQWKEVKIPLTDLGADQTQIDRFDVFNDSADPQPEMLLDDLVLTNDGNSQPPSTVNASVTVDTTKDVHAISPYIYGVAFGGETYVKANHLTLDRWGGNSVTRYNWRLGSAGNTASDWYFENTDLDNPCHTAGCAVDQFVQADRQAGAASLITVPTLGWVAKDASLDTCGFKVSKYGQQQQTDPYRPNCGNGLKPNGSPITGNSPTDTSVRSTPADIRAWIKHLIGKFGTAAKGGVRFYAMDNEPELWNSTHRDVHPQPLTYQALYNEFETYASAVKQVDPSASIDGPVPWGWSAYFDSSWDYAHNSTSDRKAHGNLPIIPWFLKQVRTHDQKSGRRTLNVLDIHYYPQAANVFGSANDPATDAVRLRETQSLWDPTYVDESWIDQPVDLIPRMHSWINTYYPGTKLGISEWNFGGEQSMNGALAIADVLGIFGRENLYLASYWTHPAQAATATRAFDLYRNYDGHGATFGNQSIQAQSSSTGDLMSFGAVRSKDHTLTLMLLNQRRTAQIDTTISFQGAKLAASGRLFQLSPSDNAIHDLGSQAVTAKTDLVVPPNSVDLLVVPEA